MLRQRLERGGRGQWLGFAALSVVTATLVTAGLGCCTTSVYCPPPAVHVMAFGATTVGCPDDCKCVCPVPEEVDVAQGDKIWFVNASQYAVTIKAPAGTFETGDVVVIPAENALLVTVKRNAPTGDFDLDMAVAEPGQVCPSLGRPGIIIRPPIQGNS